MEQVKLFCLKSYLRDDICYIVRITSRKNSKRPLFLDERFKVDLLATSIRIKSSFNVKQLINKAKTCKTFLLELQILYFRVNYLILIFFSNMFLSVSNEMNNLNYTGISTSPELQGRQLLTTTSAGMSNVFSRTSNAKNAQYTKCLCYKYM